MIEKLPFVLQTAISLIPAFVLSLKYARPGAIRAMRPERCNNIAIILGFLLEHCSLQHQGSFCQISRVWVRPYTIEEIAIYTGIKYCNVVRCLADLRKLGYVVSRQIKRKNPQTGHVEVSPGLRLFTKAFWDKLGLHDKFLKSCQWAKENCRRRFNMPFKSIVTKVKNTAIKAGEVAKDVLQKMNDPQADKIRNNCNRILDMIHRK